MQVLDSLARVSAERQGLDERVAKFWSERQEILLEAEVRVEGGEGRGGEGRGGMGDRMRWRRGEGDGKEGACKGDILRWEDEDGGEEVKRELEVLDDWGDTEWTVFFHTSIHTHTCTHTHTHMHMHMHNCRNKFVI